MIIQEQILYYDREVGIPSALRKAQSQNRKENNKDQRNRKGNNKNRDQKTIDRKPRAVFLRYEK